MKKISLYISALALAVGCFTACEDDKDTFTVQAPAASTVEQSVSTLVINDANLNEIVYTLNFSASDGDLKNDAGAKLGSGTYIVECSLTPDFTGAVKSEVVTVESGNNSKSYTGTDLNTLAASLGAEAEKATTVYFRVIHTYNEKTAALGTPSNVVELNLTPCKVVPTLNVLSKDGSEVVAKLQLNSATNLYEGEYTYKEWNFYFVDALDGTVYGCDDAYTKPDDGVNRSCNIVKGRAIGDDYSMWFDPSIRPVTMKVDLENMTWTYERIATEKKDLTGVSIIIVGGDMGWHDSWTPDEGVEVTSNGDDTYTAVFENVVLTKDFGFRATEPASAWLGPDNFASLGDNLVKDGNIKAKANGIYTVTVIAKAEADGSISYTVDAVKTGDLTAQDLSAKTQGIKGSFNGWTVVSQAAPSVNGNVYTYVMSDIEVADDGAEFGFDGDLSWVGNGGLKVETDLVEVPESGNLKIKTAGIYTFTLVATALDDGGISYSMTAEKTGDLAPTAPEDYSAVELKLVGVVSGNEDWSNGIAKTPTVSGENEYTYVYDNVQLVSGDKFKICKGAWEKDWGFSALTANDSFIDDGGNIAIADDGIGIYKITFVINTATKAATITAEKSE
jgi:hypothetical protein